MVGGLVAGLVAGGADGLLGGPGLPRRAGLPHRAGLPRRGAGGYRAGAGLPRRGLGAAAPGDPGATAPELGYRAGGRGRFLGPDGGRYEAVAPGGPLARAGALKARQAAPSAR